MDDIDYKARYETLVRQLNADGGDGVYPMGHLTREQREDPEVKKTDAYKCGWNDSSIADTLRLCGIMKDASEGVSDDMAMLLAADVGFLHDGKLDLNMNDTWGWAVAWCPTVEPEQLKEVARLFRSYGHAGLMYWHSCQENNMHSEFPAMNRAIDFVRREEEIARDAKSTSAWAYKQVSYTLGAPEKPEASAAAVSPNPSWLGRLIAWINGKETT